MELFFRALSMYQAHGICPPNNDFCNHYFLALIQFLHNTNHPLWSTYTWHTQVCAKDLTHIISFSLHKNPERHHYLHFIGQGSRAVRNWTPLPGPELDAPNSANKTEWKATTVYAHSCFQDKYYFYAHSAQTPPRCYSFPFFISFSLKILMHQRPFDLSFSVYSHCSQTMLVLRAHSI